MKSRHLLYAVALALPLAACDNSNNGPTAPPPPAPPAPTTLASFMAQLFSNTTATATPVEINGLQLDTSSEEPTQFDALII